MRQQARTSIDLRILLVCCLCVVPLALPVASASAQDDLDEMMQTDPDRPAEEAAEEGEGEGEAEGGEGQAGDDERPAGEAERDEERPPGEPEEPTAEEAEGDEVAPVEPEHTEGFEVALLGGYGISFADGPNIWSGGFGLRLGYDLGSFLIGGRFVYYTGGSEEQIVGGRFEGSMAVTVSASIWELSVEAAYDAELSPTVSLRPGIGLGFANASREGADSKLYGAISPGMALLISPSPSFFLGLDARFQVVTATPEAVNGLILLATLGMRF